MPKLTMNCSATVWIAFAPQSGKAEGGTSGELGRKGSDLMHGMDQHVFTLAEEQR